MPSLPVPETPAQPLPESGLVCDLPERLPESQISILIVGGGVAGLFAALECWRKGHNVRIIERSPSRSVSGDGFSISTSAIRALQKWPQMAEENERISYEPWVSWHKITGEMISGPAPFQLNQSKNPDQKDLEEKPVPKVYRHSRPKMHKMLCDQLERVGIIVEYGKQVVEYYEDADLVIAADGVGGKSSRITLGREVPARPIGYSIYRASYPLDQALCDLILDEKLPVMENGMPSSQIWLGEDVHAVFGRSADEMTWYLTYPNHEQGKESWSHWVEPETVLKTTAIIKGWPKFANRLIQATPKGRIHDFKLMWREPQPCWTSAGGRVVQIGDAAHTFHPSSGQGATQGMEDAVSIAACLQMAGKDNIPWATRVHNKLRFERVSCLQLLGVVNQEIRHRSVNAQPSQTKPIGLLGAWIWEHDPEQYAIENYDKAMKHLADGCSFQNNNTPHGYSYRPWTLDELLSDKEMGKKIVLEGDWE
ncbi:uncharacterized protein N7483_005218 [Penicillium malachiteum]|uniref:uncharacterized protein n=1 Tax=Penicillium malachiteum TaxID=1324776 RepID=UPI0025487F45|nr:uncharacterized protein N7483_005218 [Penicillium malachiteum]KAJ5730710.1 hypothetical protein N7483_005218 [Penicillium malachiteum]